MSTNYGKDREELRPSRGLRPPRKGQVRPILTDGPEKRGKGARGPKSRGGLFPSLALCLALSLALPLLLGGCGASWLPWNWGDDPKDRAEEPQKADKAVNTVKAQAQGEAEFLRGDYREAQRLLQAGRDRGEARAVFYHRIIAERGLDGRAPRPAEAARDMEILAWKFAEIRDMALSAPGPERPLYQTALALLHYRGLAPGQGRDSQTALSLARQAASKGFSPAMNLGAAIAREGEGSFLGLAGSGPAESFNLSRKAAEAGDLLAMGNLSCLYRLGLGVEADIMRAASWAYKAATRPEPLARAMNELGLHYQEGRALSRDEREAARWYGLAAKMGYALAVRNLSGLKSKSGGPPGLDDSIEY